MLDPKGMNPIFFAFCSEATISWEAWIFLSSSIPCPCCATALAIISAAMESPSAWVILASFFYSFCITLYLYISASCWATCFFSIEFINSDPN